MTKPLEKEYEFYLKIREELAQKDDGRFVAIKGEEVLGIYDDYLQAANTVYVEHERGTVLMQQISKDANTLVVTLHTPGIATIQ